MDSVDESLEEDAERIDHPERNQNAGETFVKETVQIVRLCHEAGDQAEAGEEKEQGGEQEAGVIQQGDRPLVIGTVGGDLLGDMMQNDSDACESLDQTCLVQAHKDRGNPADFAAL